MPIVSNRTSEGEASNVRPLRAADRIYEEIRKEILSGRLTGDERLVEGLLAERFGSSRTPVRSAIVRLASDGFVEITPHSGTKVRRRSRTEIAEVYEVRAVLESAAAGLAAIRRTEADIAALDSLQVEMERQVDAPSLPVDALTLLNKEFHLRILRAGRNGAMMDAVVRLLEMGLLLNTYASFTTPDFDRVFYEHRNILRAIRSHDAAFAEAAMRTHMHATRSILGEI